MNPLQVQTAPFKEYPLKTINATKANEFDIIEAPDAENDLNHPSLFLLNRYCYALLNKLFSLSKSQVKPFIQYQCSQINEPIIWLNKFEKLIDLNRELIVTKQQQLNSEKAIAIIELLREKLETEITENGFVKQHFTVFKTPEENNSYLLEVKNGIIKNSLNDIGLNYNKKISGLPHKKFKINSNINCFVDVFFQLTNEKHINGKPYLEAKANELAQMITANFCDKEGNDISIDTVKTILKPSRVEKRPKGKGKVMFE